MGKSARACVCMCACMCVSGCVWGCVSVCVCAFVHLRMHVCVFYIWKMADTDIWWKIVFLVENGIYTDMDRWKGYAGS